MSNYDQADFYFKRAITASKNEEHQKAIELYTKAIEYCKDEATERKFLTPALLARAGLYWDVEEYENANYDCDKVIEISPNKARAWALRGACHYEFQEYDDAIEDLNVALEIDPEYIWALQMLSMVYEKQKKFELGLRCVVKCIDLAYRIAMDGDQFYWCHAQAGLLSMKLGNYDEAIEYYRSNGGLERRSLYDKVNLAKAYRLRNGTNDLQGALEILNSAISKAENRGWIWAERGRVYKQMGELEKAVDDFTKALECNESLDEVNELLQQCLKLLGRTEEDYFRTLIDNNPKSVEVYFGLVNLLLSEGRGIECEKICQKILKLDPTNSRAYFGLSKALEFQGRPKGSVMALRQAINCQPEDKRLYILLVELHTRQGNIVEAEKVCNQVVQKFPDFIEAHCSLASLFEIQGRIREAEKTYRRALEIDPDYELAKKGLSSLLSMKK